LSLTASITKEPLDRRRDARMAEVGTRLRALSGGQLAATPRLLAMIAPATANGGAAKQGVTRYCSTTTPPPSAVGSRPPVGRAPCPCRGSGYARVALEHA